MSPKSGHLTQDFSSRIAVPSLDGRYLATRVLCQLRPFVRTLAGLPVQKVVVKRTFLENASDDESEGEEI